MTINRMTCLLVVLAVVSLSVGCTSCRPEEAIPPVDLVDPNMILQITADYLIINKAVLVRLSDEEWEILKAAYPDGLSENQKLTFLK